MRMISPVPGERFIPSRFLLVDYLLNRKSPQGTFRKPTKLSPYITHNGQAWWYVLTMIASASTCALALGCPLLPGHTAPWQMQGSTFLDWWASAPRHNGLTTTYFSGYGRSISKNTTSTVEHGIRVLSRKASAEMGAKYGLGGIFLTTAPQKSLMKIVDSRSLICQTLHHVQLKISFLHSILTTLIVYLTSRKLLGSYRRTLYLLTAIYIVDSLGIRQMVWCTSQKRRRLNTSVQYKNGENAPCTCLVTCRSYTASFCMCHWYSHEDERTSQNLRLCCGFVMRTPSYHIVQLKVSSRTLNGGLTSCRTPSSVAVSQHQLPCSTQRHTPMQALESASRSSSASSGEHGSSTQVGRLSMAREISDGPKPSVSSFSFDTLSPWIDQNGTTEYMVTTKELLKVGRMDAVATPLSMRFSGEYLESYKTYHPHTLSTQYTLPATSIQLTHPLGEYMETLDSSSHLSPSPFCYAHSFTTPSSQYSNMQPSLDPSYLLSTIPTSAQTASNPPVHSD